MWYSSTQRWVGTGIQEGGKVMACSEEVRRRHIGSCVGAEHKCTWRWVGGLVRHNYCVY